MVTAEEKSEKFEENGSVKLPEEERLLGSSQEEVKEVEDELCGKGPPEVENGNVKSAQEENIPRNVKNRRVSEVVLELEGSKEVTCGIWCLKGSFMQRFASKKSYLFVYSAVTCLVSATFAYSTGTITTVEKRFKIRSTNTGIISVGGDFSQLFLSLILNYYAGKGHRPRWMSFGISTIVIFCLLTASPHFIYGAGESALSLTEEYGARHDANTSDFLVDKQNRKLICQTDETAVECDDASGNFAPQVILFVAQLISGVGGSVIWTLGAAYMDDNIQKDKTPALVSMTYFFRMLGPATGYGLASTCLKAYIAPSLTPTISRTDPRWLGAWWLGWIIIAVPLVIFGSLLALFPKSLPRAVARKVLAEERKAGDPIDIKTHLEEPPASLHDMKVTVVRLMKNKIFMCNTFSSVFFLFGYMPYWLFLPKYIETMFKQTASFASFVTGSLGIVFTALGILLAGAFMSKVKPSARSLAAWNVTVGVIAVLGTMCYAFLPCTVDQRGVVFSSGQMDSNSECNEGCHCDYVRYSPVCSPDGQTFISPCHAGCRNYSITEDGTKVYLDCTCAPKPPRTLALGAPNSTDSQEALENPEEPWIIKEGPCPIDCSNNLVLFLIAMCVIKFSGGTGRTSNFLVSMRCVEEKDKTFSMGVGLTLFSLLAFIPSPIIFGYLIDTCCLVWGKTCSGTGNCWLYDNDRLRYLINFSAGSFLIIGTLFDLAVWIYAKDLKIFDEEVELEVAPQRQKTQRK